MYQLDKFDGHRSSGNGDISSYINSYMNISEKAELIVSICHIERFSKSGIPSHNFKCPTPQAGKQGEEERQLQSVMLFTQRQSN